jgi:CheY-like chemotaxis protein
VGLAKDGREGLAQARAFKPDIILLDVMMPDIGGIEVIRELQSSEELRAIPVLIMTGTYFDRNMSELFKQESNCKEFLSKTMELSWVAKRVEALLEKK